jgi:hypothetical protein
MSNFKIISNLGKMGDPFTAMWVEIKWKDGKLSITGVHGPKRNGDCSGSAGQCSDVLLASKDPKHHKLKEVWDKWHLNDMNAACEHQEANWDFSQKITTYKHQLKNEVITNKDRVKNEALKELKVGETVKLTEEERELLNLEFWVENSREVYKPEFYFLKESKTEKAHHVSLEKGGLLGKPCEVCGYKYGTAWLKKEVPEDVIEFLKTFEDHSDKYPWGKI